MEVKWTDEQKKVIEYRNRDILVSAAAGSGKTAVLVERIINRIAGDENPIDIDRILVVTFTKAAAAEMRERVSRAIEQKRQMNPKDDNLQKQATIVHNALITTIDSFCLYVVKNNFSQIDLDPDFRIGDQAEITLMQKDVMAELFEENYEREGNEAFLRLVDAYHKGRNDDAVRQMVEQIYKTSSSSSWPKKWIENLKSFYNIESAEALRQSHVMKEITVYAITIICEARKKLYQAYELAKNTSGLEKYAETINKDLEYFEGADEHEDYESVREFIDGIKMGNIAVIRKFDGDEAAKERVKSMRNAVKETVASLKKTYFTMSVEKMYEQLKRQKPYIDELVRLALEFSNALEKRKAKKRVYDFSDIEHFALRILVDENTLRPTEIAADFSAHFEEIMIDEYQDSNQVQEDILKAVSKTYEGGHNMFMVGDVKQSIYRFRLARPELFMEKYNTFTTEASECQRIDLHKNFRSRRQVIDFANDIFYKIMSPDLGKVAYDEDAQLHLGASYEEPATDDSEDMMSPELLLIDFKDEELEGLLEDEENDKVRIEALMIANRINKLISGSYVTDKKTQKLRKARYSDIVILLRSVSAWGSVISEVLKDCGIPAHVESSTGYFSSYEIQVLLSFLKILDNPLQDIPMAAVLSSPIVGLDDEELAQIKALHRDVSFSKAALLEMEQEDGLNEKLTSFGKIYRQLRGAVYDTSIHQLLYMILEKTGFDKYAAAMPAGKRRRQNIKMLIDMAVSYEKTSYKGLYHFVRYIDVQQKYEIDYGQADLIGENEDVVRIMTIHKSKGLEFPIVFVSGMGKKINTQELKGDMVIHSDLGIGLVERTYEPRTKRMSLMRTEIEKRIRKDDLGEELRILYVALTRAKEKLILTGGLANMEKSFDKYCGNTIDKKPISFEQREQAICYLDWVIPAMLSYPEKYTVESIAADEFASYVASGFAQNDMEKQVLIRNIESVDIDTAKKIANGFTFEYEYANDVRKKSKYSVSELKHDSMEAKFEAKNDESDKPEFLKAEQDIYIPTFARESVLTEKTDVNRGALRGTAVHRVMECLDFKSAAKADFTVKAAMDDMLSKNLITQEIYSLVNIKSIEAFMMSASGKRMIEAAKKDNLFKEKPFVMDYEGVLLQGIIDVFWIEDDGIVLLDYKTDNVKSAQELVDRYDKQLQLYAEALERLFAGSDEKLKIKQILIYSFKLKEEIEI